MFEVVIISTTEPVSMRGLLSLRVDGGYSLYGTYRVNRLPIKKYSYLCGGEKKLINGIMMTHNSISAYFCIPEKKSCFDYPLEVTKIFEMSCKIE